ncbi:MAG: putative transposase [Candidatus Omnitrophota bacterium]
MWTTRFAKKILVDGVQKCLENKLKKVWKYHADLEIVSLGFVEEHVHVIIEFPPKYSGSYIVETIKKNTTRHLKKKFKFIQEAYWDGGAMWSVGYIFSTVDVNEKVIKKYIEHQRLEDLGQAELEF